MTEIETYIMEHHKEICISEIARALGESPQRIYNTVLKMGLINEVKNNSANHRIRKRYTKKDGYFDVDAVGMGGNWLC